MAGLKSLGGRGQVGERNRIIGENTRVIKAFAQILRAFTAGLWRRRVSSSTLKL